VISVNTFCSCCGLGLFSNSCVSYVVVVVLKMSVINKKHKQNKKNKKNTKTKTVTPPQLMPTG